VRLGPVFLRVGGEGAKLVVSLLFSLLGVGCNRLYEWFYWGGGGGIMARNFLEEFDLLVELGCVPERGFFFF